MTGKIRTVAILGAGTMGHGIAQATALAGYRVSLYDTLRASLEAGSSRIQSAVDRLVEKGALAPSEATAAIARISTDSDLESTVKDADLIVEAVPERIEAKLDVFRALDRVAKATAILATNTSSLSVSEIAGATERAQNVVGLHFFNPVSRMRLVEIVRGLETSTDTLESASEYVNTLQKESITVNDSPGFATSRLGLALGAEAIRMVEQGVASPADIDRAMELGYAHPMGPLRLTDLVGLDVRLGILEHLHHELGEVFRPPTLLRDMVKAGKLGRKSGVGFYVYPR